MTAPRCKVGDLCVVVQRDSMGTPDIIGRFVVVVQSIVHGHIMENGLPVHTGGAAAWLVRSAVDGDRLPLRTTLGRILHMPTRAFFDDRLRPIRPNEGEDESLSWARPVTGKEKQHG